MSSQVIPASEIDGLLALLTQEARPGNYHLNPDIEFTRELLKGLLTNEKRYGYRSCPCRLASGDKQQDLDIICPCDYRDTDLDEYSTCYCGLYVSQAVLDGDKKIGAIPERRPPPEERKKKEARVMKKGIPPLSLPVWRCKVCGYLCARESPPETCPICKAKKERFERFI